MVVADGEVEGSGEVVVDRVDVAGAVLEHALLGEVGGWVGYGKVEEDGAVRMRCWKVGVGWVGGWLGSLPGRRVRGCCRQRFAGRSVHTTDDGKRGWPRSGGEGRRLPSYLYIHIERKRR